MMNKYIRICELTSDKFTMLFIDGFDLNIELSQKNKDEMKLYTADRIVIEKVCTHYIFKIN